MVGKSVELTGNTIHERERFTKAKGAMWIRYKDVRVW